VVYEKASDKRILITEQSGFVRGLIFFASEGDKKAAKEAGNKRFWGQE
jgi:hypothetical protein